MVPPESERDEEIRRLLDSLPQPLPSHHFFETLRQRRRNQRRLITVAALVVGAIFAFGAVGELQNPHTNNRNISVASFVLTPGPWTVVKRGRTSILVHLSLRSTTRSALGEQKSRTVVDITMAATGPRGPCPSPVRPRRWRATETNNGVTYEVAVPAGRCSISLQLQASQGTISTYVLRRVSRLTTGLRVTFR